MVAFMTSPLRRFASTIFVFFALLVACAGAGAATRGELPSCHSEAHATVASDDVVDAGDPGSLPSLEDNGGGLDDTFDVPSLHVVTVPHHGSLHPGDVGPAPHAHHHSLELRPPIA